VHAAFASLSGERPLPLPEMDRFRVLAEAHASADAVVDGIEEALDTLRVEQRAGALDSHLLDLFIEARVFERASAKGSAPRRGSSRA
jgi:hypothetical protein